MLCYAVRACPPVSLPALQVSRRDGEGCGPESLVGNLFPRTVDAAMTRLADLVGASLEGARKVGGL